MPVTAISGIRLRSCERFNVKIKLLLFGVLFTLGIVLVSSSYAEEPLIPPSISKIWPAGMKRGSTATFTIDGRNLSEASGVIFDTAGISGKVTQITDVSEKITGPRAGVDTSAQVPLGKKQTARLEVTVAKNAVPGIHRFRVRTPLGTTNTIAFAIGTLPEVQENKKMPQNSAARSQRVELPATLIGTIAAPGDI